MLRYDDDEAMGGAGANIGVGATVALPIYDWDDGCITLISMYRLRSLLDLSNGV